MQSNDNKDDARFPENMSPSRCSPPEVLLYRISLRSAIYFLPPSKIHICTQLRNLVLGFPGSSDSKGSACSTGDPGSIPGWGRPRGEEMATYSNILAWRIPWTEEPGRLQSMRSQRVRHNLATKQQQQHYGKHIKQ